MKAFHGDPTVKAKYVERAQKHRATDTLVQGLYWDGTKGCAVGCTLEQNNTPSIHAQYETELGVPQVLARIQDLIFESLSAKQDYTAWPEQFLTAIPVGADLRLIWPRFAVWLLTDDQHGTRRLCRSDGQAATDHVVRLFESAIREDGVNLGDWHAANAAATAAATAASAAADAARTAIDIAAAAHAANAAAYAANAAACAAADTRAADYAADAVTAAANATTYATPTYAAAAAARQTFWRAARDKSLQLLNEAPV